MSTAGPSQGADSDLPGSPRRAPQASGDHESRMGAEIADVNAMNGKRPVAGGYRSDSLHKAWP